jgi:hypothetical protein
MENKKYAINTMSYFIWYWTNKLRKMWKRVVYYG